MDWRRNLQHLAKSVSPGVSCGSGEFRSVSCDRFLATVLPLALARLPVPPATDRGTGNAVAAARPLEKRFGGAGRPTPNRLRFFTERTSAALVSGDRRREQQRLPALA